ncbi:MAG TPA: choline dehydrogenase [Chloroflexia bacterium]|nr:choline dehydrogenase [Chloroflexia bacterium]
MFDYIIVGAGSAGCVLANRLTEDSQTTVLLIEAGGPDQKQEIHIPIAFSKLYKTPYDWAFYTEEDPNTANRKLYWPRGKMLGGCSSINAMIYIRGNRYDYDTWRSLGNPGWSFDELLPYFKKSENQEHGSSEFHGQGGPLNVSDLRYTNPLSGAFIAACQEMGYTLNKDFNGAQQDGIGFYQVTQKKGKRHSVADAYLKPATQRPNLTVLTNCQVARVLFEENQACGVLYRNNGRLEEAKAAREVILCGGAINSPQLLLLSGIGPASQLKTMNITVVANLPGVGQNLQDHPAAGVLTASTQPVSLDKVENPRNLINYLLFQKGPFTSNVAEAGGFVRTQPDLPAPDLQFHFAPVIYLEHGFKKLEGYGYTIGPTLINPQSRGSISLRSKDPFEPPLIRANYLSSDTDLQVLLKGLKLARQIAQAKAFEPYRGVELMPGPDAQSDEALYDHIRQTIETLYHPAGTCKMGTDEMAVVDPQLRVRGVTGLRVVDASIMPTVTRGNTNAPTIMIAEKAADMIKTANQAKVAGAQVA